MAEQPVTNTYVQMHTSGPALFASKYEDFVCAWEDVSSYLEDLLEQDVALEQKTTVTFELMEMTEEEFEEYCDANAVEFGNY